MGLPSMPWISPTHLPSIGAAKAMDSNKNQSKNQ